VRGIRARDGFVMDIDWKAGRLTRVAVRSLASRPLHIRYAGQDAGPLQTVAGRTYVFDGSLKPVRRTGTSLH
jgi:alpha-L-fucosidase 2